MILALAATVSACGSETASIISNNIKIEQVIGAYLDFQVVEIVSLILSESVDRYQKRFCS